jgi:hypothetical protein
MLLLGLLKGRAAVLGLHEGRLLVLEVLLGLLGLLGSPDGGPDGGSAALVRAEPRAAAALSG